MDYQNRFQDGNKDEVKPRSYSWGADIIKAMKALPRAAEESPVKRWWLENQGKLRNEAQ